MLEDILFWEKFRPRKIEQIILLPRISDFLSNGIKTNVLLHGYMGTGKSTLSRVLLEGKTHKKINASLKNGVDILREELYDFCTSMPSPFNRSDDKMKYVYLEEFDKATSAFQDAFKAFIEEYDNKVRFIITMNHIENAIPEIRSRFNKVDFNPQNEEEKKFLKKGYFKYLKSISIYLDKKENFQISDEVINKILLRNFPDLRSSVQDIQQLFITKNSDGLFKNDNNSLYIHQYILNGKNNPIDNFDFVENNFLDDPSTLLKSLGRPLVKYIIDNNPDIFKDKGFLIIKTSKEHAETFNNQMIDPIIHLSNYINELKKIIYS